MTFATKFSWAFISSNIFLNCSAKRGNIVYKKGSFILTSGFLSHYPNASSIATGPLNAAVDTFVRNVSPLLSKGIKINAVSPAPVVLDTLGHKGVVTAIETARYYKDVLDSDDSGKVLRAWGGLPLKGE